MRAAAPFCRASAPGLGGYRGEVHLLRALQPREPLFCSRSRVHVSKRRVQFAFRTWQVKAGFDRLYPFRALRHTAMTNVYRASRNLFLAQRFARHVSPVTTTVYTHPGDEDLFEGIRNLPC